MSSQSINKRQIIILVAIAFLVLGIVVIAFLPVFHVENQESIKASYAYLEKDERRPSLLPDDLSAAIVDKNGSWEANGPVSVSQLQQFVKENKPIGALKLRSSDVNAEALACLIDCGLTDFRIYNNDLGSQELRVISTINGLKYLHLEDNRLSDSILVNLAGPEGLKTLIINQNKVGKQFIEHVSKTFKSLETLDLSRTDISASDLSSLSSTTLKKLKLYGCPNLSGKDQAKLRKLMRGTDIGIGKWGEQFD